MISCIKRGLHRLLNRVFSDYIMTSRSFCAGREEALADVMEIVRECKDLGSVLDVLNESIIKETIGLKNTERYQRSFKKGKVVEKRKLYCLAKKLHEERVELEEFEDLLEKKIAEFNVGDC